MYTDRNGDHWYRGNLHTHTTISDGRLTPEEAKCLYKSLGYDFIAITDHWKWSPTIEKDESGLVVLSGAEYNFNSADVVAGVFHTVGFGTDREPMITKNDTPQYAIDTINECGGLAMLAHPAWSLNTHDSVMKLRGLSALEIYNSVSGMPRNCRPYSGLVTDQLAARGISLPLTATDDTHFYSYEVGLSYIMVNLKNQPLTPDNIMRAVREKRYYATQGPIFDCRVDGDEVIVECETDAEAIVFFTNRPWEPERTVSAVNGSIRRGTFKIKPHHTFVRAEIIGTDKKVGYAQTILVNQDNTGK